MRVTTRLGASRPGGTASARAVCMRSAGLLAATCFALCFAPACADPEDIEDEPFEHTESHVATTSDERAFLERAYETFVAKATTSTYAPLREGGTPTDLNNYYRTTCSAALVGALRARVVGVGPAPVVLTWIRDAIAAYPNFKEASWGYHVRWAPAVDCLLAASVATPWLSASERSTLRKNVAVVADAVFSPAEYLRTGKSLPGNSQAEEAALAADLLYIASRLAGSSAQQRDGWRRRAADLFRYAASIPKGSAPYEGEAFRRKAANGTSLGDDQYVVSNHGMEVNPYYSLGALISYADATVVARATGESLPPGISVEQTTWNDGKVVHDQLGVRQIFAGGMKRVDRTTFGWKGTYRFIGEAGEHKNANAVFDYGAQTQTIPIFPPNSELFIPTNGAGSVTQFFDPFDGKVKSYQIDGGEIRAFECGQEVRGWFCRARYKARLAELWSKSSVLDQSKYGAYPIPTSNIDTFAQWVEADGSVGSDVYAGNRVWRYVCSGNPRVCRAVDSVPLSTHLARFGFTASTAPISRVDAASAFIHIDGTGRRYWVSGNRIYRAVCRADFTGCSAASSTLAEQFAGLTVSPPLPTDRVDSLVQYVMNDTLHTYVFRGDRLWKYECTSNGCRGRFSNSIADQWRGITNQERWASGAIDVLRGVTDWGVQATMMNATFALANVLGVDGGAYGALLSHQRKVLKLADRPLLPSTFDPSTGRFGYGRFGKAMPVTRYGTLVELQDGWLPRHIGPYERLNAFTWMNIFAARNHAIAFMLKSDDKLVAAL